MPIAVADPPTDRVRNPLDATGFRRPAGSVTPSSIAGLPAAAAMSRTSNLDTSVLKIYCLHPTPRTRRVTSRARRFHQMNQGFDSPPTTLRLRFVSKTRYLCSFREVLAGLLLHSRRCVIVRVACRVDTSQPQVREPITQPTGPNADARLCACRQLWRLVTSTSYRSSSRRFTATEKPRGIAVLPGPRGRAGQSVAPHR